MFQQEVRESVDITIDILNYYSEWNPIKRERLFWETFNNIKKIPFNELEVWLSEQNQNIIAFWVISTRFIHRLYFERNFDEIKILFKYLEQNIVYFLEAHKREIFYKQNNTFLLDLFDLEIMNNVFMDGPEQDIEDEKLILWLFNLDFGHRDIPSFLPNFFKNFPSKIEFINKIECKNFFDKFTYNLLCSEVGKDSYVKNYILVIRKLRGSLFYDQFLSRKFKKKDKRKLFIDEYINPNLEPEQKEYLIMKKARETFGNKIPFIDKNREKRLVYEVELISSRVTVEELKKITPEHNDYCLPLLVLDCFLLMEAEINFKAFEAGILN